MVCNPTSIETLDEIVVLLDLPPGPSVLDIGCGKGELLLRAAERYGGLGGAGCHGVGVDPSPYVLADLRAAAARRVPASRIELVEAPGASYEGPQASFDMAACVGATWAFDGLRGTLAALGRWARPGGLVLVGEPFWRREPAQAYLDWSGMTREEFGSHAGNVRTGVEEGLVPLLAFVSTEREWDRYETLQWRAAARYAAAHPDDPDVPELLERVERGRHEYLEWGRDTLGWALYLFRRP